MAIGIDLLRRKEPAKQQILSTLPRASAFKRYIRILNIVTFKQIQCTENPLFTNEVQSIIHLKNR